VFYRFFSKASWVPDVIGAMLFKMLLSFIPGDMVFVLVDDTLTRKTGPRVWGAGMHHDAVASTYGRNTGNPRHVAFAFGHNWVILAVWIPLPWNPEQGVALPVLMRLYRSKKLCPPGQYRKRTVMALELVQVLREWVVGSGRRVMLMGDSEYACRTLIQHLPPDVLFTGPVLKDAALFTVPVPRTKRTRGAPPKRGMRLPTPTQLMKQDSIPWIRRSVTIYGRPVTILVKTLICQWYRVTGAPAVRIVITRDPKRRIEDRAYFCTNPNAAIEEVLTWYSRRWSLEVTFFNTKQYLGLEDPQNGWGRNRRRRRGKKRPGPQALRCKGKKAVERTVPWVFYVYGFIYLWYFQHGKPEQDVLLARWFAPWYRKKKHPSFCDVLGALQRDLISDGELFMHPGPERLMQELEKAA
jgi:hypothetical protein